MKKIALTAVFALSASTAFAGGLDPVQTEESVIMPVETIEEQTVSSDQGILIPLFALVMFGAALTK